MRKSFQTCLLGLQQTFMDGFVVFKFQQPELLLVRAVDISSVLYSGKGSHEGPHIACPFEASGGWRPEALRA